MVFQMAWWLILVVYGSLILQLAAIMSSQTVLILYLKANVYFIDTYVATLQCQYQEKRRQ